MSAHEYRLSWKRRHPEGGQVYSRARTFQSWAAARRLLLVLLGRGYEIDERGPDALWCCSGWECGCGGVTVFEHWQGEHERITGKGGAMLRLTLSRRPVGRWASRALLVGERPE